MHFMVKTNMQNSILLQALYWREHLVMWLYYQHVVLYTKPGQISANPDSRWTGIITAAE